jgi:hypothetical protein
MATRTAICGSEELLEVSTKLGDQLRQLLSKG